MEPDAAVGRRHGAAALGAPAVDHPVDSAGIQIGAVREDDQGSFDIVRERGEPAAERGAGAEVPLGARDDTAVRLERMGPRHDDNVVDGARTHGSEDAREEHSLLRRARPVPGRGTGCEDDRVDQGRTLATARATSAFATGTFQAVRGRGVTASRSAGESRSHGMGATPASAIRVSPPTRAAATPT